MQFWMSNLTLHPLWHTFMPAYERSVAVVTLCLSTLAFYLMTVKTPHSAKPFVKYLILLQAFITLVDVNYGILYCPISLFPVIGCLCYGILCTWLGFTGHVGMVINYFTLSGVGISIIYCFHYKYVHIGQMVGKDSLESSRHTAFRVVVIMFFLIPSMLQSQNYRNLESGPLFVRTEFPSLYYLFENPEYHAFAYDQTMFPEYELVLLVLCVVDVLFMLALLSYFVICSLQRLSKQNTLSERTRELQRKTMMLLIIQTLAPVGVLLVPLLIEMYATISGMLDPNIANVVGCFQLTHSFFHSIILIATTPSYRRACMFWQKKKASTASLFESRPA